jgi:hypothetical protein
MSSLTGQREEVIDLHETKQRLRQVEVRLHRIHAEIHGFGSFDSAPYETLEECARLWNEFGRICCRIAVSYDHN